MTASSIDFSTMIPPFARLCRSLVLFVLPARDNLERVIGQWPLQRLRLIPRRAHPDVPFLVGRQDHWHGLGMDGLDDRVRCGRQEAVDQMRPGIGFDLVPRSPLNSVQMPPKADSGRSSLRANQTTSFFLGLGVRLRCIFGEAVGRHEAAVLRLEPARQCGDDVFRMFVTGNPPPFGGGGIPQRIIVSSRSPPALRTTGAG